MDGERKQRLKSMLRAVQDSKSDYYIGTQKAFNAVRAIARVYDEPQIISSKINERANIGLDGFLATPERLNGIGLALQSLELGFAEELGVIGDVNDMNNFFSGLFASPINLAKDLLISCCTPPLPCGYQDWVFGWPYSGFFGEHGEREVLEEYGDRLLGYSQELFSEINRAGIRANKEFGDFLSLRICEGLEDIPIPFNVGGARELARQGLISEPKPDKSAIENFPLAVYQAMRNLDWEEIFSSEIFNESVREHKKAVERNYIVWGELVKSVTRDRVDHRLEYRRQILTSYLLPNESITYEALVEISDRRLRDRRSRLSRLMSRDESRLIVKNEKKMVNDAKFIRHLIGSEKSWLIKFLRN